MSSANGMTLLLGLTTGRALGLDVDGPLAGLSFTEADLRGGQAMVPWDDAARFWTRLRGPLSPAQVVAFMSQWTGSHPLIRVVSQLTSSTNAWLHVYWTLSRGMNSSVPHMTYALGPTEHVLECRLAEGLTPCPAWFELTHHAACQAPTVCGDEPLVTRSVEWSGSHLLARYAAPVEKDRAGRLQRASGVPYTSIFESLAILGEVGDGFLRDGHFAFDPSVQAHVDEVATFARTLRVTLAEARVALKLAAGGTPATVAEELGVAVGTVRVHLRSLYEKTDTAGQRELVERVKAWRLA